MKEFNLSEWLKNKSRKIITRDGRPVRILDYNLKGDKPICIAVDNKTQESITTVDEDGHCLRDKTGWHESDFDLFFADEDEEELTETGFEKKILDLINYRHSDSVGKLKCVVKEEAKILLDLARKELEKEIGDKCWEAYLKGEEEALKDLPKFKIAHEHKEFPLHVCVIDNSGNVFLDTEVNDDEYYIEMDDLKTLPKDE